MGSSIDYVNVLDINLHVKDLWHNGMHVEFYCHPSLAQGTYFGRACSFTWIHSGLCYLGS